MEESAPLDDLARESRPLPLAEIRARIGGRPGWRIEATLTSEGVPGLEPDEIIALLATNDLTGTHCSVISQKIDAGAYVVDGVSVIPAQSLDAASVALWAYRDYRVRAWVGADGRAHYAVEQRDAATAVGWRTADEWDTRFRPDSLGGVIDCLLWLRQKGKL